MKKGFATIKDIARELKVSSSTVSRALKDHPDISGETKRAVNELAEKLNYQPNAVALSLKQHEATPLALLFPKWYTTFFHR